MKRTITFLLSAFSGICTLFAQEVTKAKSNLGTAIENAEIAKLIASHSELFPNNTQLSIALIDGDKTTHIGLIREQDVLKTIDNKESIFEIGSITKVFTSILFSKAIQDKQLSLDDSLFGKLSFSVEKAPEDAKAITLKMLANHSSGLPRIPQNIMPLLQQNPTNPYKAYTVSMLEDYLKKEIALTKKPNTISSYSNLGMGILGYILAQEHKTSFEALLQKNILQPLQMTNSTTVLTNIKEEQLVKGLGADGKVTSNWDFTDATVGAGGIKSNVIDMEKFIRKNFENDVVYNLPQQITIKADNGLNVGLGWHIIKKDDKEILFHNGGTGGYLSSMVIDKKSKKAVLILSNVSAFNPQGSKIDNLCFNLMKTF